MAWRTWLTDQWERPVPGPGARVLQPLAWLYAAAAGLDRTLHSSGVLAVEAPPRPTIVVGNLVAGGAGKTPAVMAIVRLLRSQGRVPGVVSRGYRRSGRTVELVEPDSLARQVGDEPLLIRVRTGVPVAVGADRVAAASMLCERCPQVDVIVSDDGLQHHRLGRQVEVLVFDDRGVGNGLMLPAGPLRQALDTPSSAPRLVLYSTGRASTPLPGYLGTRRLRGLMSLDDWWKDPGGPTTATSSLRDRPVVAAAGLARPRPFFSMLEAEGLRVNELALADHYDFDTLPWPAGSLDVVVTEKDAVKLRPQRSGETRIWVAQLDFEPEPAFGPALLRLLTTSPP